MNNIVTLKKNVYFSCATRYIIFALLTEITRAVTLKDLQVVCAIKYTNTSVKATTLPSDCTAIASSHSPDSLDYYMIQQKIPFFLYITNYTYENWKTSLNNPKHFIEYMVRYKIAGIIFNNMYQKNDSSTFDSVTNNAIYEFFTNLKLLNPIGLYGLTLPHQGELVRKAFNYTQLNPVVDFFVLKTLNYRPCVHRISMKRTATVGDMEVSVTHIRGLVLMRKIVLVTQLYMEAIKPGEDKSEKLTYSDLCGGKSVSHKYKYCKDSLKSLYNKASLCNRNKMCGVYIKYIDFDDYMGLCECPSNEGGNDFPGVSAIVSAIKNTGVTECPNFGNEY